MQIEKMTWKDKVWVTGLVLAAIFVLFTFSVEAIKDSGNYFGSVIVNELTFK